MMSCMYSSCVGLFPPWINGLYPKKILIWGGGGGGARVKRKHNFRPKFFKKVPKNAFFGLFFFSIICLRRRKFGPHGGLYSDLAELRKSIWSTCKEVDKIF